MGSSSATSGSVKLSVSALGVSGRLFALSELQLGVRVSRYRPGHFSGALLRVSVKMTGIKKFKVQGIFLQQRY